MVRYLRVREEILAVVDMEAGVGVPLQQVENASVMFGRCRELGAIPTQGIDGECLEIEGIDPAPPEDLHKATR
jgi:hypothetical protein